MKKMWIFGLAAVVFIAAWAYGESLERGLTWLESSADEKYSDGVYVTTDAALDSSYTKWYTTENVGEWNSLRVVFDSIRAAFTVAIDLQESWDGTNVEFTTEILSFAFGVDRTDTVVEVDLYPAPYTRFLIRETDAAATESLQVDTLTFYSR